MRNSLEKFEGKLVTVRARIKYFRDHHKDSNLNSVCLSGVKIFTPIVKSTDKDLLANVDHLWILTSRMRKAGIKMVPGTNVEFLATVTSYVQKRTQKKNFSVSPIVKNYE